MASYRYHIVTPSGVEKKGLIEAADRSHALTALKAGGNTVISVGNPSIWDTQINLPFTHRVKARDMSVFCRQFVSIISAGVSITRALEMLVEQTENKTLKEALRETRSYVERGESLSESMRRQEAVFPKMFINLVQAGEESGKLELSFERMAIHYEKSAKIQSLVAKTLIYPIILGIASVVVITVMMVYIVPMYSDMFAEMDTELPMYTRAVVAISNFMVHYWYLLLLFVGAMIFAYRMFRNTNRGKYLLASVALKIPIFGKVNQKSACAQFARNLSTLLTAGVPIMEALNIVADTMNNPLFQDAMKNAREQVARGISLAVPLRDCGMFPPMVYHMVNIGEETGGLDGMLDSLAVYYEEEVEAATEKAAAALEPLIILFMAFIVIAIIMAVYTPMLSMYQNAGNL
ncbi:type II secretion system F family protein [Clostridium sp. AM58-1XD]|uniref:type II secretion system F family protein n=1 Tax=Clostridium sp. AM58-1XD TaxID=2292307 RepID=UPI000E4F9DC0|nr:type II secretion system F family protein [Clostridium sp. AM58-1XD]RGZ00160.1 type II secretion system F family protein [Clostridium sp. AM58-1XD]